MRNAASSVGEYLPASIAAIVWRVTPIRSPRSAWVISPVRKRKVRMSLTIGGLAMPAPPIADDHQNVARRLGAHERQQRGVGDLPAQLADRQNRNRVCYGKMVDVRGHLGGYRR